MSKISEKSIMYMMLGLCPALAISTTVKAGLAIGLITLIVIILSNTVISLLRNRIPEGIRTAVFVIIIATFVSAIQILLECYQPELKNELGLALPLVVVNGTVLGSVEKSAYKNKVIPAIRDGFVMGLAFLIVITLISSIRELFGHGSLYGMSVLPSAIRPIGITTLAPGAFFVLAILLALANKWNSAVGKNTNAEKKLNVEKNRMNEKEETKIEEIKIENERGAEADE